MESLRRRERGEKRRVKVRNESETEVEMGPGHRECLMGWIWAMGLWDYGIRDTGLYVMGTTRWEGKESKNQRFDGPWISI